jgi:hypothetical protein
VDLLLHSFPGFCTPFRVETGMSLTGTVKNGVIILPPGTNLPQGAQVKVETIEPPPADSKFRHLTNYPGSGIQK